MKNIFKILGMPFEIIGDWAPKFFSEYGTILLKMRGNIKLSTTSCLQLNKQLETLRTCYEHMLVKNKNLGTSGKSL
jgi:hypothetical protein